MVSMTVDQIGIYTVADLERERDRDDRLRWELLEGDLVVTPAPRPVRIWDLVDGAYVLTTHGKSDQEVRVSEPVELTFRVVDLMPPQA